MHPVVVFKLYLGTILRFHYKGCLYLERKVGTAVRDQENQISFFLIPGFLSKPFILVLPVLPMLENHPLPLLWGVLI